MAAEMAAEDFRSSVLVDALKATLKEASETLVNYFTKHRVLFPRGHKYIPEALFTEMFAAFIRIDANLAQISHHRARLILLLESQYVYEGLKDLKGDIEEALNQMVNISIDELDEWEDDDRREEWLNEKAFSFKCHYDIMADNIENIDRLVEDLSEVLRSYD
jgi:hypothetical protein